MKEKNDFLFWVSLWIKLTFWLTQSEFTPFLIKIGIY